MLALAVTDYGATAINRSPANRFVTPSLSAWCIGVLALSVTLCRLVLIIMCALSLSVSLKVDVVFDDELKAFWSVVYELLSSTKRPFILTANGEWVCLYLMHLRHFCGSSIVRNLLNKAIWELICEILTPRKLQGSIILCFTDPDFQLDHRFKKIKFSRPSRVSCVFNCKQCLLCL